MNQFFTSCPSTSANIHFLPVNALTIVMPSPASYTSGHLCSLIPVGGRKTSRNDPWGRRERAVVSLTKPLLAFTAGVTVMEGRNQHTKDFSEQCLLASHEPQNRQSPELTQITFLQPLLNTHTKPSFLWLVRER